MDSKQMLRKRLRDERRRHVAALPDATRALVLRRPPAALVDLVPSGAAIGLYVETAAEAPASGYARWFFEEGHGIALPAFASDTAEMQFRAWTDPFAGSDLAPGRFGIRQPAPDAPEMQPGLVFVPLLGFDASGGRLGQGGGHYDRWLAAHPDVPAIGLAWDCQLVDKVPSEAHDRPLHAVVTPTRLYGPF